MPSSASVRVPTRPSPWSSSGPRLLLLLCVCQALLNACGAHRAVNTQGWLDVRTAHVRLRTDVPQPQAQAIATSFQAAYDAFAATTFPCASAADAPPVDVTLLRSRADFEAVFGTRQAGFYSRATPPFGSPRGSIVLSQESLRRLPQLFNHELVHHLTARCLRSTPPWLSEGLAEALSTATVDTKEQVLSVGRPAFLLTADMLDSMRWEGSRLMLVPRGKLPSLEALLRADDAEFYGANGDDSDENSLRMHFHYAGAWALVHMLLLGPDSTRQAFAQYLADLRSSEVDPRVAWRERLGRLPLERDYAAYLKRNSFPFYDIPYVPQPRGAAVAAPLSRAEAHLHWALLRWRKDGQGEQLARHARAALDDVNTRAQARVLLALAAWDDKQPAQAVATIEQGLREQPASPELLEARLWLLLAGTEQAASSAQRDQIARRLVGVATSASQLCALAQHELARGDPCRANAFAQRSVEAEPQCVSCQSTLARTLALTGRTREAIEALEQAQVEVHQHEVNARRQLWRQRSALLAGKGQSDILCAPASPTAARTPSAQP
jgi:tetratricopeptide (TPR) repeat protein